MSSDRSERRRAVRIVPGQAQAFSRIRLRTGRDLAVLDISPLGAAVEGAARLLPGTNIDVHVTGAQGRLLVRARVVRCTVCALTACQVKFRGALAFCSLVELAAGDPRT